MNKALIIGYGNPLRSDDGFGWHAGRLLARELAGRDARVVTCHQLTPELAEPLSQCRRAVFIDAAKEGQPGCVQCRPVYPQAPTSSAFTHSCSPSGLLASAQELYGHSPQAVIVTVTAQSFAFGESLSPVVSDALPEVVDRVRQFVSLPRVQVTSRDGTSICPENFAQHPSPCHPFPLFPLPGEREEGEGSWGEGAFSCFALSQIGTSVCSETTSASSNQLGISEVIRHGEQ